MADQAAAAPAKQETRPHRERVPVEHRFGGLDRRSFVPALVVVGIWLLWAVALPHLDGAIDHDDQVQAGERFAISEDLAITPPPGWSVIDGFRTSDVPATGSDGATFSNGTVTVYVDTDDYTGTPSDLLEQIDKVTSATGTVESFHVTDGRATVSTSSGLTGVSESYTGRGFEGTITAFVSDGTGIEIMSAGQPDQKAAASRQIAHMIDSIGAWDTSDTTTEETS